ncbi:toxin glutamine deamidase domain-containing protein [Streptomyces sp. NPDC049577]|uniref:toxin glutamine deamidase domain-containing protein n=1 Tax=Streptomyces sp. NPDC049577 TaxID=3155153 RepID=UPI00343D04C2
MPSKERINPDGGQENCGLCAKAGDDLMTGRNPNAVPGARHLMSPGDLAALTGRPFVRKGGLDPIVREVLRWGPGARGIVGAFPRRSDEIGHYFNVVNVDGKVVFLDFQQGRANSANPRWNLLPHEDQLTCSIVRKLKNWPRGTWPSRAMISGIAGCSKGVDF